MFCCFVDKNRRVSIPWDRPILEEAVAIRANSWFLQVSILQKNALGFDC